MKTIASALLVAGLLIGSVADANAVVCARGAYHAGCAGPHGAAVTHRGYAAPVHRGYAAPVARHCYYRAGVRVCR